MNFFMYVCKKIKWNMEYTTQIKQNSQSGWFIGKCEEIPEAITWGKDMDEYLAFDICKQLDIPKPKIN